MLSIIKLTYSSDNENKTKFMVNDSVNQKVIKLNVYFVKGSWYVDISDNENDLLLGKVINTWIDLFELLRIHDKTFPNLKLVALPSNINGINKEFVNEVPGVLQQVYLLREEEEHE